MPQFIIERDNDRPLTFNGKLVASTSSRSLRGPNQNRWVELSLYRTSGGKLIAETVHRTCWQGEYDTHKAIVCCDNSISTAIEKVIDFFGMSHTAKDLYAAAGFDIAQSVE